MDWLTNLLKHLTVSRSITGAVFITALALHLGPKLLPGSIDPVPKEWTPVVTGCLIFSGSLLSFWGIAAAWSLLRRGLSLARQSLAARWLTHQEEQVLLALAGKPTDSLNVEHVNFQNAPFTQLELIELLHALAAKGLVRMNSYDENLVSLTPRGRAKGLKLQRGQRQQHAA